MRAYRLSTGRTIVPFGDAARDLHIGARLLSDWQADAVKACGLALSEVGTLAEANERPCLLFADDVWFSEMALRQFLADALQAGGDRILAMPASGAARACEPLQEAPMLDDGARLHDVYVLNSPSPPESLEALHKSATPLRLLELERKMPLALPPSSLLGESGRGGEGDKASAPITARLVANVRHWIHLLRLSQLSIGVTLLDQLRTHPRTILKLKWLRRLGLAHDAWSFGRHINFVHPSARVHPSADLECAVIGPGAVIEAHAHVHRSVLGPGVVVQDHARIVGCTLAERVQVLRASYIAYSAAMPGGTLANYKAQLSLFGRDVFLTTSAWLIDAKLKGEVKVEHQGQLIPVGPFLGVCLGHRVTLGAQVAIQAGRAVPNGSVVVGDPGFFASETGVFPEGTLLTVRAGKLVPIQSLDSGDRGGR